MLMMPTDGIESKSTFPKSGNVFVKLGSVPNHPQLSKVILRLKTLEPFLKSSFVKFGPAPNYPQLSEVILRPKILEPSLKSPTSIAGIIV